MRIVKDPQLLSRTSDYLSAHSQSHAVSGRRVGVRRTGELNRGWI
jgi:hypothetical protein